MNSREARTGHSTHFNAPFVSDNKRHAPARNEATNGELREASDSLLVDALAHYMLPHWRANGLMPLVPSSDAEGRDKVVRPLLAELAARGALPVLNRRQAAELAVKGKRGRGNVVAQQPGARGSSKNERRYRFLVPALTWAKGAVEPLLALLCPPAEMQLDPRAHASIVRLLAHFLINPACNPSL